MSALAVEPEPVSVSELSRRLDLPKSSVADTCGVLIETGVLVRDIDGRVQLGPKLSVIARGFVGGSNLLEVFPSVCADAVELRGRTIALGVLMHLDVVYLAVRPGDRPLSLTLKPGMRLPAWSTGTGRALLSELPDATLKAMHADGTPASPSGQPFALDPLIEAVTRARRRGYASNTELGEMGLAGVAALVRVPGGSLAAVSSVADLHHANGDDPDRDADAVRTLADRLTQISSIPLT